MNQLGMRFVSASLALLISCNPVLSQAAGVAKSSPPPENDTSITSEDAQEMAALPDTPSASWAQSNASPAQSSTPDSSPASGAAQTKPQQPTGTAAAPEVTTSGNAASRPAGAAIAPPKQRQVH